MQILIKSNGGLNMKITLELPEEVIKTLNIPKNQISSELKIQLALYLYEKGKFSFGKARELSGLSVWEFMDRLRENQIPIKYDVGEFQDDLETIKDI